jgi:hypothetical protein
MRNDILKAVALIADDPSADEREIVERLVAQGYDALRAELLVAFAPLGLGRAVITRLAADPPVRLSATAQIRDFTNDRWLEVRLDDVPEFVAARELGEETFLTGIIPREQFQAAAGLSVELNLVNDALSAGESIGGAKASPPILLRLADAPGFEDWYQRVRPKKRRRWPW